MKKEWIIPGGRIPFRSTGKEPEMLSKDILSVLNTNDTDAEIKIDIYFEDREPARNYRIKVKAERIRKIRFNDLMDPEPIYLEQGYSVHIVSSVPIIVQFTRQDTGGNALAIMGTIAHYPKK
jgi:hypothetical protein